jgi:hypothetical protein
VACIAALAGPSSTTTTPYAAARPGVGRDRRARRTGPPRDGEAGEDEPGVAERVGGLSDDRVAGGLAEPVTATDVGAQPAVDGGQPEQCHQDDRDGDGERERAQV